MKNAWIDTSDWLPRIEAAEGISAEFSVDLVCENEWRFDHPTSVCPAIARESAGTQQNFENGIMISIEAQSIVLFTTWNGQAKGVYENSYDPNSDPNAQNGALV